MQDAPTFGPWKALAKLGEGGVCAVWRVRHELTGEEGAVKVLVDESAENVARFVDEAELLMQIAHPNVLAVHQVEPEARPPWLLMDLLNGEDLDRLIEKGPVAPRRAARLIADVADGLASVHALGIRHRDIKPGNIMIDGDGNPKLIDFGIARRIHDTRRTQAGMVVGTAAYLPPEVWGGDDPHGAQDTQAADVYALGQTLCELLIGQAIYDREGDTTLLVTILRDKLDRDALDPRGWVPDVPAGLASIVALATAQDPKQRLATADALRTRLEAWLDGELTPAPEPVATSGGASSTAAMTAGASVLAMGLIFAVTLAGVVALWVWRPTPTVQADPAAIRAAVDAQAAALAPCARGKGGTVTATWVVHDGATFHARADASTVDPTATACVLAAVQGMTWPPGTLAVTLPIELR